MSFFDIIHQMKNRYSHSVSLFAFAVIAAFSAQAASQQIIRPARLIRGSTSQAKLSLFDSASWITHADLKGEVFPEKLRIVKFKCPFKVEEKNASFEIDVSADERFYLTCDGKFVGRGPHRGTIDNWLFQSYKLNLEKGDHVIEAVVWKHSEGNAPLAQLSVRLGFALAASGEYASRLTTGIAPWSAGIVEGVEDNGFIHNGPWGTGAQNKAVGAGPYALMPREWKGVVVLRGPIPDANVVGGTRCGLWQAYPTQLKDQTERYIPLGKCVNVDFTLPKTYAPNTVTTNIIDLGEYRCAYPEVLLSGGRGASVEWLWAESLLDEKTSLKLDRREWKGKKMYGFGDTFISDGREDALFSSTWFRCGRWCTIVVKTKDEPLVLKRVSLIESRYPLECESVFVSNEGKDFPAIQDICVRSMQMCAHEMLFDCPYYEQQMYPGDTRAQLNVISSMTFDDALVRRAVEFYDFAKFSDGLVPFNFPTRGHQEGLSYTLCYLLMHPDYMMRHSDRQWLRSRLVGYRNTLSGIEYYARKDGLLADIPGWTFIDWPQSKDWVFGNPPGALNRDPCGVVNAFWVLALRGAERVEKAMGNNHIAKHWGKLAEKVAASCRKTFWDESRQLFADDPAKRHFSEHTQAIMLLADVIKGEQAQKCFEKLISDPSLTRTTVYFKYYLFETFFKFNRPDLFLKELDLWRSYLAIGCTTCLECPETKTMSARSDCHAWGSHPLYFLRAGIAGITPASPFFSTVRIAPQPGSLKSVKASWPHPCGKMIEVDLTFDGEKVKGKVFTPVPGSFEWKGVKIPLKKGSTNIAL
jgi:hypothetical protein